MDFPLGHSFFWASTCSSTGVLQGSTWTFMGFRWTASLTTVLSVPDGLCLGQQWVHLRAGCHWLCWTGGKVSGIFSQQPPLQQSHYQNLTMRTRYTQSAHWEPCVCSLNELKLFHEACLITEQQGWCSRGCSIPLCLAVSGTVGVAWRT